MEPVESYYCEPAFPTDIQNPVTKRIPRPSPTRPGIFEVISRATVRTGKSLSSDVLCDLSKGTIMTANQLKGRRIRIVDANNEVVGWASLFTDEGYLLIIPYNNDTHKINGINNGEGTE